MNERSRRPGAFQSYRVIYFYHQDPPPKGSLDDCLNRITGFSGFRVVFGGHPALFWPLERERLNVLFEYSQKVHVGYPLAFKAHDCRPDLVATRADYSDALTIYMVGYGEDSCCVGDSCGSVGLKTRTGNGFIATILMIQSKEKAHSFGMPMIDDGRGERFAHRLIVVADDHRMVRGIFHNLDQKQLVAALQYVVSRPRRGPSPLAYTMDW